MEPNEDWQAWQFADECARIRQTIEALEKAAQSGAPKETLIILADESGVGEIWRKHEAQ